MTTIITRLYPDTAAARAAVDELLSRGHSEDYIDIITAEGDGPVSERIRAARVNPHSAMAYAGPVAQGGALVVVRAPFNPMGAARHAIRVIDLHPSVKVGVADENEYIRVVPVVEPTGKILRDHPLVMSNPYAVRERGTVSAALGLRTLSARGTKTSAIRGGAHVSTKLLPFPLVWRGREKTSASGSEWQFSRMFGIPTLLRR